MDKDIEKQINELLDQYFEEILNSLEKVIKIRSVMDKPKENMPFGEGPAKALIETLEIAKSLGFEVKNVDNYAGHVEYGITGKLYAILGHLDVVPEGDLEKWNTNPYELTIKEGKMFGRGVSDDKGPSIGALYALKIVSELIKNPKNTIRIIFGTNEENGSKCLKYYFTKEPYPYAAVTPDGTFPLVFAEKGNVSYLISTSLNSDYHTKLVKFKAGTAVNVVPEKCVATIETNKINEISYLIDNYKGKCKVEYRINGNEIEIITIGKSAHASTPHLGVNAVSCMLDILTRIDFGTDNQIFETFYKKLGKDVYGKGLDIYGEDKVSGNLTCNLGIVDLNGKNLILKINIRYPIFFNVDMITLQIKESLKEFNVEQISHSKPLYVSQDSELVKTLLDVYRNETNDESEPIAIGGGTYARTVPYGVAFGATFPGENTGMHQPNENWSLESYKKFIKIYAKLLYKWLTESEKQ